MSSFTQPHVFFPNLYEFIFSAEHTHKDNVKNVDYQTVDGRH